MKRLLYTAFLFLLMLAGSRAESTNVDFTRIEDVVYGRKFGTALTMDVFQPKTPNGAGIIMVMSGGWVSGHEQINPAACQVFLRRGYTVFTVVHGCQPRFIIPEITQDMSRAVRFIKHNAAKYGVDPNKLGVTGGSAGGHLSLTLGTQGKPGTTDAKDPIDRESSTVQCVACFFPPTDFLNYGKPGEDATGVGTLKNYKPAFGPQSDTEEGRKELGRQISPIYYVTSNMPPTLIIHGNADTLVPIQQAEIFVKRAQECGAEAKLIVKEGAGHGWPDLLAKDLEVCADWFDAHLRNIKK
ncbi:alpha/beta hydrolase [Pedosphaera parvula]|uniref:Alpha/beta hydrolase domain-containing protein n=1 Tax=Pedosphaera parvula (strain Ellin514) TaxID=320771 RepID=B9XSM6_PEDPL|nr:alpha/beta hydrolase [Pedosphaera parvula]EEF57145.1 alpha/beta hydrolase domain-containing protein [Pedosphaera parvula Ellin514]